MSILAVGALCVYIGLWCSGVSFTVKVSFPPIS